jgi:hypothetical protein
LNHFSILARRVSEKALPAFLFVALACGTLTGCDLLEMLKPGMHLGGGTSQPNPQGVPENPTMTARERAGFHRWLVTEMQEQIFARPLKDKSESVGWANVLSQRGSIEGVYHGFVLSTEYMNLEQAKKPADTKALRFFGNEMARLDFPSAADSDDRISKTAAKYLTDNMSTSIFTLKRELGERILREADKRKVDGEKLAAWYSGIAARWAKMDVPFGLAQRNDKDEVFHFNWAKENTLGMIEWELLNREHRIFNQFAGIAVPVPEPVKPAAPAAAPAATPAPANSKGSTF